MKSHPRLVFWIRLISWILVGCVIPIVIFAVKFGLFTVTEPAVDPLGNPIDRPNIALNGWGIIACVLLGSYLTNVVKEIADASTGYSFAKQIWKGLSDTIPLIVLFVICYFLSGVVQQVMFCLATIIICKLVATPINPLPKWKWEKRGVEDYSQLSEVLTKLVQTATKGGNP